MHTRLAELDRLARTERTRIIHADRTTQLQRFMEESLGLHSLWAVTPADIVMFLISRDQLAHWVDHTDACPLAAVPPGVADGLRVGTGWSAVGCGCPTRLRASSVDTIIGSLRAVFNEKGLTGPYDPVRGAGNPCDSYAVRHYLYCMQKEQAAKGLRPHQAPVFSEASWTRLLDHVLDHAAEAARTGDGEAYFEDLRDAFLFALLFRSMQRGDTILSLTEAHLQLHRGAGADPTRPHERGACLYLHVPLTKTGRKDADRHNAVFVDEPPPGSLPRLWHRFNSVRHDPRVNTGPRPRPADPIFTVRSGGNKTGAKSRGARQPRVMTTRDANARLLYWISRLDPDVPQADLPTLHSFRGSGAIAALQRGADPQVVSSFALWADDGMREYYTLARQLIEFGAKKAE
jgi:hypothetical protein